MTDRTSLTNAVVELRRAANSIFTAADQPVAGEISAALVQAANEIERLRNIITGCPVCSELERNIKPAVEPGAVGWQPIEAAPKGGAWVLLWWPTITDCAIVGYHSPYGWHSAVGGGYESGDKYGHPTHWMPLPKPPELKSSERAPEVCGCPYGQCHCDDGSQRTGASHD